MCAVMKATKNHLILRRRVSKDSTMFRWNHLFHPNHREVKIRSLNLCKQFNHRNKWDLWRLKTCLRDRTTKIIEKKLFRWLSNANLFSRDLVCQERAQSNQDKLSCLNNARRKVQLSRNPKFNTLLSLFAYAIVKSNQTMDYTVCYRFSKVQRRRLLKWASLKCSTQTLKNY